MEQQTGCDGLRVAIVGGGIIGCLSALFLKKLGARPVILERGRTGHEASWAGAGILCPIHPWLYPDSFTHLVNYSLAMYPSLAFELKQSTGISIECLQSGLLIPFFEDDVIDHRQSALQWSQKFDWLVKELDAGQLQRSEPVLSEKASGGLLWPEVRQARNPRLLKSVRRALEMASIEVHEGAEVSSLNENPQGEIAGLSLADGRKIDADAVLLAAGSWSGELAQSMGISLPVEPVKGQIALVKTEPGTVRHIIKHDDVYFVPRQDGRVLIGASMERVGFTEGNTEKILDSMMQAAARIAPGLETDEVEHQWMGFRPGSPDGLPYLGPVEGRPGLWVATGHYRNGVLLAPGTAKLMSCWMMGVPPDLDMHDFRVDRPSENDAVIGLPAR